MCKPQLFRFLPVLIFLATVLGIIQCTPHVQNDIPGLWQSLNDPDLAIELTADNQLTIFRDQKSFLTFTLVERNKKFGSQAHWLIFNGTALVPQSTDTVYAGIRLEKVNDMRIRFYIHKHHDILDIADEFHKAKDLHSYREIMDAIADQ